MKKSFTLLQLFSIVDGRLSTEMGDVYEILNHLTDDSLMTHHLPVAMKYVEDKNPQWFQQAAIRINAIKAVSGNTFETLIDLIKDKYNEDIEVPQLKDEFDTSDFIQYMLDNSLLLKKAAV